MAVERHLTCALIWLDIITLTSRTINLNVLLYLNLKEISGKRGWKIAAVVTNFVSITEKGCGITAVLKNKPCQLWLGESSEC